VNLPDGAATAAQPSLSRADDHDRVYYGGAAFALAADVEIRRRTGARARWMTGSGARSRRGEGDGGVVRRGLHRGHRSRHRRACREGAATSASRSRGRRARPRRQGSALDLARCAPDDAAAIAGLLDALGVRPAEYGGLRLDDTAALAGIRRTITPVDEGVAAAVAARPEDTAKSPAGAPGAASKHEAAGVEKP
jgi:hypothetical protein